MRALPEQCSGYIPHLLLHRSFVWSLQWEQALHLLISRCPAGIGQWDAQNMGIVSSQHSTCMPEQHVSSMATFQRYCFGPLVRPDTRPGWSWDTAATTLWQNAMEWMCGSRAGTGDRVFKAIPIPRTSRRLVAVYIIKTWLGSYRMLAVLFWKRS